MKINTSVALKAGLIGAAAGLVFGILTSAIPFLVCLVFWIGPLIALAIGALYVYFAVQGGAQVAIGEGALGGALAGAIAGAVQGLVSSLWALIFSHAAFLGVITGLIGGAIGGAIAGAVGGAIWAAIKGKK